MEEKRPILLQGAMQVEIAHLLEQLEDKIEIELYGYTFWKGKLKNYPAIISKTGIGSIHATTATTIAILEFRPSIIINQGIAGACQREIHKYDVVFGQTCVNTNCYKTQSKKQGEGSSPLEWELITFTSDDEKEEEETLQADSYLLSIAKEVSYYYAKGNIHYGILGSGDCWNKEIDRIDWINHKTNASCADMESIGVYSVANQLKVPVLGIRVMSDNELLKEEYDRETSIEAQRMTLEIAKKYIQQQ